jgi:polyhydroxyalkanoate synthesis regulator phasin
MMDANQMLKQMLEFNKAAFDNSFNAMLTISEQNEKMVNTFLEQATWMPEEGKKLIKEWVETYKKGGQDFKKTADANYKKISDFFESAKKSK